MRTEKPVVVGIGPDGSAAAVAWAVDAARREARPLHLVRTLHVPATTAYAAVHDGATDADEQLLADAVERAEKLGGGGVPVTGEVVENGWVVEGLVHAAEQAHLVVLEHQTLGRVHRLLTGSVVQGVAAKADAPVVSVPAGWAPVDGRRQPVTVAVQDVVEAGLLLREAFHQAEVRREPLTVLHAWWLWTGNGLDVVDAELRAERARQSEAELAPVLGPLRRLHPDVDVTVRVEHATPAEAVLDAAESSSLLVVGRRHHRLPPWSHLGPVAHAAVTRAACPVLIAPETADVVAADVARVYSTPSLLD